MNITEIVAYQCGVCKNGFVVRAVAEECCKEKPKPSCQLCGTEDVRPHYYMCDSCSEKRRYEKSKKVFLRDYKEECFYDDRADRYFKDIEDFLDYYESEETKTLPEYCLGCDRIDFVVDIDHALESAEEEMGEDFDDRALVDREELEKFVSSWNEKQTARAYSVNYKTTVILSDEPLWKDWQKQLQKRKEQGHEERH